ncbi:hypothetical protein ACG04Q_24605 [Roseateles sp. DXS20W]|uniref:Lipid A biosynthesis lauroyl acyltransferase n=1 Tax=Pelomonas lactea TaxID=3299030 RepID=A0ABW7GS33_9BURK
MKEIGAPPALRALLWLPTPLRDLLAVLAASGAWLLDRQGCRSTLMPLLRQALACGRLKAAALSWRATFNAFQYWMDSAGVMFGPAGPTRRRGERSRFDGAPGLHEALAGGRGALLAASFHACFYFALLTRFEAPYQAFNQLPLHLVLPRRDAMLMAFIERIAALGGRRCGLIVMGDAAAAVQLSKALKRGELVLCMVDSVPDGAAVSLVTMFGRPTLLPAGFLMMASRLRAPVLTCHTERSGGAFVTRLSAPLWPAEDDGGAALGDALAAALEHNVRRRPGAWNSWLSLRQRWQMAADLTLQPES